MYTNSVNSCDRHIILLISFSELKKFEIDIISTVPNPMGHKNVALADKSRKRLNTRGQVASVGI